MQDDSTVTEMANLRFATLDPARPTADQIHAALKSAILRMDLSPGVMISETETGARFGASRTPVREAFARLREDGLIVTRPSRGTYVARLSEQGIRQAQFLREGLELANIRRLCETGLSPTHHAALQLCLEAQSAALDADDPDRFQAQDDAFHRGLARATGYPRAEGLLMREKAVLDRLRVLSLASPAHRARLLTEHQEMFAAVTARETARAEEVTRLHLRSVLSTLSTVKDAHGGFFE
jgi:DNA-binding GntR family transcriptional regulator